MRVSRTGCGQSGPDVGTDVGVRVCVCVCLFVCGCFVWVCVSVCLWLCADVSRTHCEVYVWKGKQRANICNVSLCECALQMQFRQLWCVQGSGDVDAARCGCACDFGWVYVSLCPWLWLLNDERWRCAIKVLWTRNSLVGVVHCGKLTKLPSPWNENSLRCEYELQMQVRHLWCDEGSCDVDALMCVRVILCGCLFVFVCGFDCWIFVFDLD